MSFLRSWCLLLALPSFVACGYGDHTSHDGSYGSSSPPIQPPQGDIESATIDVDQQLDVEPGAGAGTFVEYDAGGTYHVTTSCDIAQGSACNWDIIVTPLHDAALLGVAPVDLESDDSVTIGSGNQVRLVALTGRDFDGFTLQTDPGAAIELDALLDDGAANRYMFWVGDGALHSGAPSNPVDLVPSAE